MGSVQSTPEYDLAVVPHRPYRYWVMILVAVAICIVFVVGSYYGGYYHGTATEAGAVVERDQLRLSHVQSQEKIRQLEQKIANLTIGSQVDRKAMEQVRSQVVELKNRIAELERDNTFYRELMRPENDDKGLSVAAPSIIPVADAGNSVYDYKMVVKQLASNRSQVSGYLEVALVGQNAQGAKQQLSLHELSAAVAKQRIKLNFWYFQRIEGRMTLPDGFKPERVELKIVSLKPKKSLIEKKFNWSLK